MELVRHLDQSLINHQQRLKEAVVLLGARQVGKTTILKRLFPDALYLTVDNQITKEILEHYDVSAYRQLILPTTKGLILDEIHLLRDPGRAAKIFYDQLPEIKLFLTGSSAFNIKNRATESLAGRKIDHYLFPLSLSEYLVQSKIKTDLVFPVLRHLISKSPFPADRIYPFDIKAITENVCLYGLYPAVMSHTDKESYLANLVDSVVFKDLLDLSLIENRPAALNLLRLLAFQVGNLVNFSELAGRLSLDVKTVRRYISLFEQSFIIFPLPPYSKSGRREIGKSPKIYFYDCGLRNALISDFRPFSTRPDAGQLFENLVVSEVYKANYYGRFGYRLNFWRTTDGAEVDLVLEKENSLVGLEVKLTKNRTNGAFLNRYPTAKLFNANQSNFF